MLQVPCASARESPVSSRDRTDSAVRRLATIERSQSGVLESTTSALAAASAAQKAADAAQKAADKAVAAAWEDAVRVKHLEQQLSDLEARVEATETEPDPALAAIEGARGALCAADSALERIGALEQDYQAMEQRLGARLEQLFAFRLAEERADEHTRRGPKAEASTLPPLKLPAKHSDDVSTSNGSSGVVEKPSSLVAAITRKELDEAIGDLRRDIEDRIKVIGKELEELEEDDKKVLQEEEQVLKVLDSIGAKEDGLKSMRSVILSASMSVPVYEVQESIWDCCLFLNLGLLGPVRSTCLVLTKLGNYFFQVMFLYVAVGMGDPIANPSEIEQLRTWRITYGHSIDYANAHSNLPLVAYVCGNADGRGMQMEGNRQSDLLDDIATYLDEGGPILCMLAVALWIMTILVELTSIARFTRAIFNAQSSHDNHHECTKITQPNPDVASFVLKDLNRMRALTLVCVVTIPRTAIALALGATGTRYLLGTPTLGDLILNCMALEVVLNVDELMYTSLAPTFLKYIIGKLEPLPLPVVHGNPCCRMLPLGRVFMIWVILIFVWFVELSPVLDTMRKIRGELCEGNTNFVFRQDLSGQYVVTIGQDDDFEEVIEGGFQPNHTYRHRAVLQATWQTYDGGADCDDLTERRCGRDHCDCRHLEHTRAEYDSTGLAFQVDEAFSSVYVWRSRVDLSLAEFVAAMPCVDYDAGNEVSSAVRELAIESLFETVGDDLRQLPCGAIRHWCSSKSSAATFGGSDGISPGDFARLICPRTCGCDDPRQGQLLQGMVYGCPSACAVRFERSLQADDSCDDYVQSEDDNGVLKNFIHMWFFEFVFSDSQPHGLVPHSSHGERLQEALDGGCAWLASPDARANWSIGAVSFCNTADVEAVTSYGYRSAHPLCPRSCGCVSAAAAARLSGSTEAQVLSLLRVLQCPGACGAVAAE